MLLDLDAIAAAQRKLAPSELGLLFTLLSHQKAGHRISPSIDVLASLVGFPAAMVESGVLRLLELGLLVPGPAGDYSVFPLAIHREVAA
jgi:hypothetical protein